MKPHRIALAALAALAAAATAERIPTGTVVIDLVDARTDRAVWRGLAKDRILTDGTPEERTNAVSEAMAELFAGFPPRKAP